MMAALGCAARPLAKRNCSHKTLFIFPRCRRNTTLHNDRNTIWMGYDVGKFSHWQPVRRIYNMLFSALRRSMRTGRCRFDNNTPIIAHCSSVKSLAYPFVLYATVFVLFGYLVRLVTCHYTEQVFISIEFLYSFLISYIHCNIANFCQVLILARFRATAKGWN